MADTEFLKSFDCSFRELHERSLRLLASAPEGDLYTKPRELTRTFAMFSFGEFILRSAAAVEQMSLGLTRKLWDDPFEWTLPESLSTKDAVAGYLAEVEAARTECFTFLADDSVLEKKLPSPEKIRSIFEILVETLSRADHFQGRAAAVLQYFSDEKVVAR